MTNRIPRDQRRWVRRAEKGEGRVCHELSLRQSDTPALHCGLRMIGRSWNNPASFMYLGATFFSYSRIFR